MAMRRDVGLGWAAVAMGIGFNIPFTLLGMTFDYPDILRQPASEVLTRFAAGGTGLILIWHAFAWIALLFAPLAVALAVTEYRLTQAARLTLVTASVGALAGLAQAIGLWRWVFVVPSLARAEAMGGDAAVQARATFDLINLYGGVAIGEHLGQLLTVMFVAGLAVLQAREGRRIAAMIGAVAALAILIGTTEGLMVTLQRDGSLFGLFTVAGYLALSVWLVATGVGLIRGR